MKTRNAMVAALAAVTCVVAPATPAAATHDTPVCLDAATVTDPYVAVSPACVTATGIYDPVTVDCSNEIYGCWARVTAGTYSSASVDADVCVEVEGTIQPLCVSTGTGAVPLVPVAPQTVCVNDSPWGPPCEPHDG